MLVEDQLVCLSRQVSFYFKHANPFLQRKVQWIAVFRGVQLVRKTTGGMIPTPDQIGAPTFV